jgi:hypothetical protein
MFTKQFRNLRFLMVLFIFSFSLQSALGGTIGKGSAEIFNNNEGEAREMAKQMALRDAIEKGVGTFLKSKTEVRDFALVKDEVFKSAEGIVSKYRTIKDEKFRGVWYYEIDAEVRELQQNLKNKLGELRVLHKQMGNKRLMVIYLPSNDDALAPRHRAVTAALGKIQSEMTKSGFRIFEQKSLGHIYDRLSQRGQENQNIDQWKKIANDHQVDILIEFEVFNASERASRNKYKKLISNINVNIYDVATGVLIASPNSTGEDMAIGRIHSAPWENALIRASKEAATKISNTSINKIVNHYKKTGDIGAAFVLVLKDYSEDEGDILIEILENLPGYQSMSELTNYSGMIKIEYFSNLKNRTLRRRFKSEARKQNIGVSSKTKGNQLIFTNPR